MPGPWLSIINDPEFAKQQEVCENEFYEVQLYGNDYEELGTGLFRALTTSRFGQMVTLKYICCSDDYYAWWMDHDGYPECGEYHLCLKSPCNCRKDSRWAGEHRDVIHVGALRLVTTEDMFNLRWVKGPAKQKLEKALEMRRNASTQGQVPQADGGLFNEVPKPDGDKGTFSEALRSLRAEVGDKPVEKPSRGDLNSKGRDGSHSLERHRRDRKFSRSPEGRRDPFRRERHRRRISPDRQVDQSASKHHRQRSTSASERRGRAKERSRSKKARRSRSRRRERQSDRGPFGVGPKARGRSDSESSQDFQKASSSAGRMSHMRLVEYSNARPGQLGLRLLGKMQELVRSGGEAVQIREDEVPAVATAYFHSIFQPAHRDMSRRNAREARTLCKALDLIAQQRPGEAADLLGQRLKAVEKAHKDGNDWSRAQWLELLPPEGLTLMDREEEYMTTREEELQRKLHQPSLNKGNGKGKENKNGKGKFMSKSYRR